MKNRKHAAALARTVYPASAGVVLCFAVHSVSFMEGETDLWAADGLRIPFLYEHVGLKIYSDDLTINLTQTPLVKSTYYQKGADVSIARLCTFSDHFTVERYTENGWGGLESCGHETKARTETGSDFYSPLLTGPGPGQKTGHRIHTDFGVYEIM